MKKSISLIIIVLLLATLCVFSISCDKEEVEVTEISIVAPDGAPALAISSLIKDKEIDGIKVNANVVSASTIGQEAIKSDFAIMPVNAAAKLYNNGAKIKVVSTVTNGNLFILSSINNPDFSLQSLKGKMFYSIGQAAVPAAILISLLQNANIEYEEGEKAIENKVCIKYVADGAALLPFLMQAKQKGEEVYGLLAEPAVSKAVTKGLYNVADVQDLYKTMQGATTKGFAQAVLVCKSTTSEAVVKKVIKALQDNVAYVESNPQEAVRNISGIFATTLNEDISVDAIKGCNIRVDGFREGYSYIDLSLKAMNQADSSLVGEVPALDSGFYY